MIFLIIDPGHKFVPEGKYHSLQAAQVPKSIAKAESLTVPLYTRSVSGNRKQIVIWDIDDVSNERCAIIARIASNMPEENVLIMVAKSERDVSKHINNLLPKVKRIRGKRAKREEDFFSGLRQSLTGRRVPKPEEMITLLSVVGNAASGDVPRANEHNLELACELDNLLFKADSKYLAYAWACLHEPQAIPLIFEKKKKEEKPAKKKRIKKAKITKVRKKVSQQSIEDYF